MVLVEQLGDDRWYVQLATAWNWQIAIMHLTVFKKKNQKIPLPF